MCGEDASRLLDVDVPYAHIPEALVSNETPAPTPQAERAQAERGASVDFRVGLGLRAALPVTNAFRGAIGIEGDWGPESTGVGAYLGIEAVIR